jgi:hypothetical protein
MSKPQNKKPAVAKPPPTSQLNAITGMLPVRNDRNFKNGTEARPHPSPLPREREKRWQRSLNTTPLGADAVFERTPNHATNATKAFELSSIVQNLPLSPGERAGVRASPLALPRVHQTLKRASL